MSRTLHGFLGLPVQGTHTVGGHAPIALGFSLAKRTSTLLGKRATPATTATAQATLSETHVKKARSSPRNTTIKSPKKTAAKAKTTIPRKTQQAPKVHVQGKAKSQAKGKDKDKDKNMPGAEAGGETETRARRKASTSDDDSSSNSNDNDDDWRTAGNNDEWCKARVLTSAMCEFDDMVEDMEAADPFAELAAARAVHKADMARKEAAFAHAQQQQALYDDNDDDLEDTLWESTYAPKTLGDIAGNNAAKAQVANWLFMKQKAPDKCEPALLLAGPSGVGKTLLVRMLLRDAGYAIWTGRACNDSGVGMPADEARGTLDEELESVLSVTPLQELVTKPVAVLLETIDGLPANICSRIAAVLKQFSQKTQKRTPATTRGSDGDNDGDSDSDSGADSNRTEEAEPVRSLSCARVTGVPVILTADSVTGRTLSAFKTVCAVVRMHRSDSELARYREPEAPSDDQIRSVLYSITKKRGVKLAPEVFTHVIHTAHGSVRAAVNSLQFLLLQPSGAAAKARLTDGGSDGRDEVLDLFAAADRLCYGARPTVASATATLECFSVNDAENVVDMATQSIVSAVDARALTAAAKLQAIAAALDVSAHADVLFHRVAKTADFTLAEPAVVIGTWGTATALRSLDAAPCSGTPPVFGRIKMNSQWGFQSKVRAAQRRLRYVGAATMPGLSKDARELACRLFRTAADAKAAEEGLDDVVAAGHNSALSAAIVRRRRQMRKEAATALVADMPRGSGIDTVAPPAFQMLERVNVLRLLAHSRLAQAELRETQYAKRKAVLSASDLYVPEEEAQKYLQKSPFTFEATTT